MKTFEEVLEVIGPRASREIMEQYISREWIRPAGKSTDWHF